MYLLFVILMVIAALLMCFIVLIQNSKGGGLASGFSGKSNMGPGHLYGCNEHCYCLCSSSFCSC